MILYYMPKKTIIDEFLKEYQFNEFHRIDINGTAERIYEAIKELDFCRSRIIRGLFTLRGLPRKMCNLNGAIESGFIWLDQKENEEMVLGFLMKGGKLLSVSPQEFLSSNNAGHLKGVWNFLLTPLENGAVQVSTETRVYCPDRKSKVLFSIYWFIIRPWSGLIRRIILKLIKKDVE